MGEYLSPGVYPEFIEPIAPIEPVSTSTAAMIGVTERGPEDAPILVGAPGEFERWFGGVLPFADYRDPVDPDHRAHCYLSHAVQGFFANGGKRLYAMRVMPPGAARAERTLFARDPSGAASGLALVTRAGIGDMSAVIVAGGAPPAANDFVRVGEGSGAEYIQVATYTAAAGGTNGYHAVLAGPTAFDHPAGAALALFAPVAGANPTLVNPVVATDTDIVVTSPIDLTTAAVVRLGLADATRSLVAQVTATVAAGPPNQYKLTIAPAAGQAFAAAAAVQVYAVAAGAPTLLMAAPAGSTVLGVNPAVAAGQVVELGAGPQLDRVATTLAAFLPINGPLAAPVAVGAAVQQVTLTAASATTSTGAIEGRALPLASRTTVVPGSVLALTEGPVTEFAVVASLFGAQAPGADPSTVMLTQPTNHAFGSGSTVQIMTVGAPATPHLPTAALVPAAAGDGRIAIRRAEGWSGGDFLSVATSAGISYHAVTGPAVPVVTGRVDFATPVEAEHGAGSDMPVRTPLLDVQALDHGAWGNRLRLSVEDEPAGLAPGARLRTLVSAVELELTTLAGLEPGTLIEVSNPTTNATVVRKVRQVMPATGRVRLEAPGLDGAALAILGPVAPPAAYLLRSREFRLTVHLLRRPDPAEPSRNEEVLDSEMFRNLSLDPRHSHYAPRIIGMIGGPLRREDRRPEGESLYLRVADRETTPAGQQAIRLGPEALVDRLASGRVVAARHPMTGGLDGMAGMTDAVYLGADNADADLRTGLFALRNLQDISLVAIPGQGSNAVQGGIITHCETMRYPVAVLDAERQDSSVADVRFQRQQFDTKNAALYYPWLEIPDPTPVNLGNVGQFPIPPAGHVLGIIARADEEGVHVPPGNMVVRGISGLSRRVTRAEHDVLNPSPININVIRDFTEDGRARRVYGARTITSDRSRKYLNVNRIVYFVQKSLEVGLQWAVLRPNAEPLWAAVRQSVTFFLLDVWRSGALEGNRPEEAFVVACDETTMSPSDRDNGRLICVCGIAPVKPAEFVIIRLGFLTRTATQE